MYTSFNLINVRNLHGSNYLHKFSNPFAYKLSSSSSSSSSSLAYNNGFCSSEHYSKCSGYHRPTFVEIVKKGTVEQYSAAPYLATLLNCMVWVLYGLPMVHPHSILVITINGSGTAIEVVYIILFVLHSDKKKRIKVMLVVLVEVIFVALVALLVLTLLHSTKQRSMAVGIICILFNIMMYASPLSVMVDSEWAGDVIGGGPGDSLCLLLQIHEETDGSKTRQGPGGFVGCCCVRVRLWRFEEDWHRSCRWRLMRVRPYSILMTVVSSNRGSQSAKSSRICVVLIFKLIF
ncbi:Bidirectional sugar transporter SWEET7 [Citrus sinensis]|nr:Bidirectional sugar transporter SWEET7 [Citrus sinensis]